LEAKLRLPANNHIQNSGLHPMLAELNGNGLNKPILSKISLTKGMLQTKSNSQPYMSLEIAQPPKRFKILKKSQELRLTNSLSRPQLIKPPTNF